MYTQRSDGIMFTAIPSVLRKPCPQISSEVLHYSTTTLKMNVLIQRESSAGRRGRSTTGMTLFLVVFFALFGLLQSAPLRQSVVGQTFGRSSFTNSTSSPNYTSSTNSTSSPHYTSSTNSTSPPNYDFSPPYCNFSIVTSESFHPVTEFKRLVKKGAIFVYLKLDFVNVEFDDPSSAYLEDIEDIIDPLTWVWSKGSRGKFLLAAPFDFNILSLTTLSIGVFSLTVKINASSVCNEPNSTDEDTINAIKGLLQDMTKGENGTHQAEVGDDGEELICLEKQLDHLVGGLFSSPYTLMEDTSAYDCWQRGEDQIRVGHTEFWLSWIHKFGVILALFSPMAMSFFLQTNPPEMYENGVERLSLVSDLPLGLKYWLCNWGNNTICGLFTRFAVFCVVFALVENVPLLVMKNTESYKRRLDALYQSNLIAVHGDLYQDVVLNLLCVAFFLLLLIKIIYLRERPCCCCCCCIGGQTMGTSSDTIAGSRTSIETGRHSSVFSLQAFFQEMGCRAKLIIDLKKWKNVLWDWPRELFGCPPDTHVIRFFILYLSYFPYCLVYYAIKTPPLFFFMQTIFELLRPKKVTFIIWWLNFTFFAYLLQIIYAWIFKLVLNLTCVVKVILHIFMGAVINADTVGPFMMGALFLVKYIVDTVTGFYDGYCVLLSDVMKETEALNEADVSSTRRDTIIHTSLLDGGNRSNEKNIYEMEAFDLPLVKYNADGLPTLELRLFWRIVEKYRPIRVYVARTCLQLFCIGILTGFWIKLLVETNSVYDLSTTVNLFYTLLLVGIFPLVTHLLESPASQNCKAEARKKELKMDLEKIMIKGQSRSTQPQNPIQ